MLNKTVVTQQLITKLGSSICLSVEQALKEWWVNIRDSGGMRLSEAGYIVFNTLEIQRWEYDLQEHKPLTPRLYLALDQKLTCPYYIHDRKSARLILFGSQEAMMLSLYGDLDQYIKMLLRQ
jgi:hypothetical protein